MLRNKIIVFILALGFLSACIKPYTPKIDTETSSKIVVSGKLTNTDEYWQSITLSKSIPLNENIFEKLTGCEVSIWDENGNEYKAFESQSSPGIYMFHIDKENIKVGTAYHIHILTPDGDELQSEPEIMTKVGEIKPPQYKIDSIYNGAYKYYTRGLQFFLDIEGDETSSNYYLIELVSTYEHHASYPREWYYDGVIHHIYPPDSSLMTCWTTARVPEIMTLSTENLSANKFHNFSLHFVPLNRDYLTYGYSLLVRQVGLSRKAFIYWESVRLNNNQNASLYNKQPVDTQGNIKNLTHPEKEVLGFFSASAISEQRIFIDAMPTNPFPGCLPEVIEHGGLRDIGREKYPGFLMSDYKGGFLLVYLSEQCVDCSSHSGTNVKPNFWPY
ncbi:MAG: DUF4249 domain-containing protein [Bacteroidales bacterium]|nr:DUF4249 domain-containing protein [Bacteroidales bacterium]